MYRGQVLPFAQPTQAHTWAYDQTGPGFSHGVGRLTSTQYPGGHTRYGYDAQGRLTSTTQQLETESLLSLQTAYGYNAAGHPRRWGQVLSLASIRSTTSRAVTMAMP
jgi:YD repeat-containing protein